MPLVPMHAGVRACSFLPVRALVRVGAAGSPAPFCVVVDPIIHDGDFYYTHMFLLMSKLVFLDECGYIVCNMNCVYTSYYNYYVLQKNVQLLCYCCVICLNVIVLRVLNYKNIPLLCYCAICSNVVLLTVLNSKNVPINVLEF